MAGIELMAPEMYSIELGEAKLSDLVVPKPNFDEVGEISLDADLTHKIRNDVLFLLSLFFYIFFFNSFNCGFTNIELGICGLLDCPSHTLLQDFQQER